MIDLRPVGYVTGLLVASLGATMLLPMAVDMAAGNGHWFVFLESAIVTSLVGVLLAVACANGVGPRLTIQQTFFLTTGVWVALPLFGAIPFLIGATEARFVDAMFEAMSGLTTTGSTVFSGLETLPEGILLWRSMLQWFGGIGIIVVAMVFLPELRIGGMQIFRSEGFDTMGKILPRAAEISRSIAAIYIALTVACAIAYFVAGMPAFDAVNHAMTTLATGGFSTRDASLGAFPPAAEYVGAVFMVLAALPFVRYVQLIAGAPVAVFRDVQVRGFVAILATAILALVAYRIVTADAPPEEVLRQSLFNVTSIMTGTGYASTDYQLWGAFAVVVFFFAGLIGGCAGSTSCSIKVFRFQILMASIKVQIQRIHSPHGVFTPRYDGRAVSEDVLSSVMAFLVLFTVTLGVTSVLLAGTGLDLVTAVSGAATAIANVGPGLGPVIGPAGNFGSINDTAKWIFTAAMLVGRLELMVVLVLFTTTFWRAA